MKTLALIFGVIVALVGVLILIIIRPGPTGVVASLWLPDGSEYMVTQKFNWSLGEPYTVTFYMRSSEGPWGWCYIDHEARGWRRIAMVHDLTTDSIVVTESGKRRAALDRKRNMFWIDNGSIRRELPAPQTLRLPEISCTMTTWLNQALQPSPRWLTR